MCNLSLSIHSLNYIKLHIPSPNTLCICSPVTIAILYFAMYFLILYAVLFPLVYY